jgi:broad specificity phosphatase PhoE
MESDVMHRLWPDVDLVSDGPAEPPVRAKLQVTFIRHAEGTHNEAYRTTQDPTAFQDPAHYDALLTNTGRAQAEALGEAFLRRRMRVDAVLVSPLRRALQTAQIALGPIARPPQVPWIVSESARECIGVNPCDKRMSRSETARQFPEFDFSGIEMETDLAWGPDHRESEDEMEPRCRALLTALRELPGQVQQAVVVSHGSLLKTLFSRVLYPNSAEESLLGPFENCEARTVVLRWT